ncbi:MAG TPA: DUF4864 domain-containing protein [Caldimonas sp.]|nr:DUF4864 domain-containing protein [Caldimonas sp.]
MRHARSRWLNPPGRVGDDAAPAALQSFAWRTFMMRQMPGPVEGVVMPGIRRRLVVVAAVWTAAATGLPCVAADLVSAEDGRAIRAVVEGQLAALAADDAKRAFAYAAPAIRQMLGTPERFMAMVRQSYPAVYRPVSTIFLQALREQGQHFQGVQITDADGRLWLATYRLEHEPDGNWRISGCELRRSDAKMT